MKKDFIVLKDDQVVQEKIYFIGNHVHVTKHVVMRFLWHVTSQYINNNGL